MATTKIWNINVRLDNVVRYVTNSEKVSLEGELYNQLHNVIDYASNSSKTENSVYVSGINCIPETALKEMIITKKQYNKTNGILAYHAYQSFSEGEVTPEQAHEIGKRLADEMWGDRFEVVISTHLNTDCIHNHFVLNSVSFKSKKSTL